MEVLCASFGWNGQKIVTRFVAATRAERDSLPTQLLQPGDYCLVLDDDTEGSRAGYLWNEARTWESDTGFFSAATYDTRGIGRRCRPDEAEGGVTIGTVPAFMTPEDVVACLKYYTGTAAPTTKTIITASGTWTVPATGGYWFTFVGGGGGGGAGAYDGPHSGAGGAAGVRTYASYVKSGSQIIIGSAGGGSGGGGVSPGKPGTPYSVNAPAGGGGGAGQSVFTYMPVSLAAGTVVTAVIGAGGVGGKTILGSNLPGGTGTGGGAGGNGGDGEVGPGGPGGAGLTTELLAGGRGEDGGTDHTVMPTAGTKGGNGGTNRTPYGGGGGGGGGQCNLTVGIAGQGGALSNGLPGSGMNGGAGGPGAMIIEYYVAE